MGTRYFLSLQCPHCEEINEGIYYAPSCGFTTWRCEYCDEEFDIEEQFSSRELAGYVDEAERDSKVLEDLVDSFQKPLSPQPVISQLAIAIEETLIVYHEPHFIRWACRALQGIVDRQFDPLVHIPNKLADTWAAHAAVTCVEAARQPLPSELVSETAVAIEAALCAQDVMARNSDKVNCVDT